MAIESGSVTVTEQITNVAIYSAIGLCLIVLLLIIQVIFLRIRFLSLDKQHNHLVKKWRPKLTQVLLGDNSTAQVLPRKETCMFIEEWNRMFVSIRGDNLTPLKKLAARFKINYFARNMLKKSRLRNRLLAIVTLGNMQEYSAWDDLIELLNDPHPVISLTAARALIQIDSKHAVEHIIPIILKHDDWTWSNVANILRQANPLHICEQLTTLAASAPVDKQPGLLRYLESTHCLQLTNVVNEILSTTKDDRVASVCLHIISDPSSLNDIRKYTSHQRWHVRMHAASALGRLGSQKDLITLLNMTEDENWWVRYRAAQAIVQLPKLDLDNIKKLRDNKKDKYARDILTHVLAETEQ